MLTQRSAGLTLISPRTSNGPVMRPSLGSDALRYAMQVTILTSLTGAYCYWRATRTLKADLELGSYGASRVKS